MPSLPGDIAAGMLDFMLLAGQLMTANPAGWILLNVMCSN
jgi:hypothetical protein